MEGYVVLHSRFSQSRVWLVLDGQHLTYYDKLDLDAQQPRGLRGSLNIRDAIVVKLDREVLRNGVKVKALKGKLTFACPDEQLWGQWFVALGKAVVLHVKENEQQQKVARLKSLLEITPEMTMSKTLISRAYKKLSLKAHPDKGGDPATFHEIREAYNTLLSMQMDVDELANSDLVHYEATIEKKPGVGLGISVTEDQVRRQLLVQSVHANTKIHFLSEESMGEIRPGDALIGIDADDCTRWPLLRVKARLDSTRVPFQHTVVLTFERRVPKEDPIAPPSPMPDGASFFFRKEERRDSPEPFSPPLRDEETPSQVSPAQATEEGPRVDASSPVSPASVSPRVTPPEPPAFYVQQLFPTPDAPDVVHIADEVESEKAPSLPQPSPPPSPPTPTTLFSQRNPIPDPNPDPDQSQDLDQGLQPLPDELGRGDEVRTKEIALRVSVEQLEHARRMNEVLATQVEELTAELQILQASYLAKSVELDEARMQTADMQANLEATQTVLDNDGLAATASFQLVREFALLCQEKLARATTHEMSKQLHSEDFCRGLFSADVEGLYSGRERKAAELVHTLKRLIA